MKFNLDYFKEVVQTILTTPSPSGYTADVVEIINRYALELGLTTKKMNKGNLLITFKGQDSTQTLGLSAHVDTLGLMVRSINSDATLRVTSIGGNQPMSLIGEYCTVHTRSNKSYTGTVLSTSPASHVYEDNSKVGQSIDELVIRLDEVVKSRDDVKNLDIEHGDFISIDTKTLITDSGYVKSRYIDDKISVAIILTVFKSLKDANVTPNHDLVFVVSTYEEVGHGASYLPEEITRFIAVDMGCIGKDLACTEHDVSICAKDSSGPYDYTMTSELISLAKKHSLSYAVDIYPMYGSDASAALRAGADIRAALIGPGVHASHGTERTHLDGWLNTMKLIYAYLTEIKF